MSDTMMPDSFTAGTTVTYTRSLPGYTPGTGWSLTVALAGAGVLTAVGTPNGDGWDVVLTASATGPLPAGTYRWDEYVSKGPETRKPASGTVAVEPNLLTATPGSLQTWEEKELAKVNAAIDELVTSGITSYQIGSRAATKQDLEKLLALRNSLMAAIRAQRSGLISTPVRFRFTGTANE